MAARVSQLIKDYCGVLTEEAIRKNLSLIYELLDEILVRMYPPIASNSDIYTSNLSFLVVFRTMDTPKTRLRSRSNHTSWMSPSSFLAQPLRYVSIQ